MSETTGPAEKTISYGELFPGHKEMAQALLAAAGRAITKGTELRANDYHWTKLPRPVLNVLASLGFEEAKFTLAVEAAINDASTVMGTLSNLEDVVTPTDLARAGVKSEGLMASVNGNLSAAETILNLSEKKAARMLDAAIVKK